MSGSQESLAFVNRYVLFQKGAHVSTVVYDSVRWLMHEVIQVFLSRGYVRMIDM